MNVKESKKCRNCIFLDKNEYCDKIRLKVDLEASCSKFLGEIDLDWLRSWFA